MDCLNFNIPQVQKDFNELKEIFKSENIAYALLSQNNGFNLDLDTEGQPSKLYNSLLIEADNDRVKALQYKAKIYSPSYLKNSNWIESNKEPDISIYKNSFTIPQYKQTSSLQNKVISYLESKNIPNIEKVLSESLYSVNDISEWKDLKKVKSMLETSSEDFNKNGLFIYKEDKYINYLNANLFEELIDTSRFIERINTRNIKENRENDIAAHKVITSKKFNDAYWIVSTDESYREDMSFDEQQLRRKNIIKRNQEKINQVNDYFINVTGKPAIIQEVVNEKELATNKLATPKIKVTFDEQALKDYNSFHYTQYLNSMSKYLGKNNVAIEEDLTLTPLYKRLKREKKDLIIEKDNLESSGGKVADINRLDNKITHLQERMDTITDESILQDIYNEAAEQFKEVDEILKRKNISPTDIKKALNKLEIWIAAGDFSTDEHPFLDAEMLQSEDIKMKFYQLKIAAESRLNQVTERGKVVFTNIVNSNLLTPDGKNLSFEQVLQLGHKFGAWNKNTLSLNRIGQGLAQFIYKIVNEANDRAFREAKIESRDLAELFYKLKNTGFDDRDFYQKRIVNTSKGKKEILTGRLVHKFSDSWFKFNKKTIKNRKNSILTLNPELLFEVEGEKHDKHVQEIIEALGTKEAQKYIDKAKKKYEDYLAIKEEHIAIEYGTEELTKEQKVDLKLWEQRNSPIERMKAIDKSKKRLIHEVEGKDTFLELVPRRKDLKGKETGFYDKNFAKIENNELAYEFYQRAEKITNNAQIMFGYGDFTATSLAFIERSLISKLSSHGIMDFMTKDVYNSILGSFKGSDAKSNAVDPITGKPIKEIKKSTVPIDAKIKIKTRELIDAIKKEKGTVTLTEKEDAYATASELVFDEMKFEKGETNLFQSLNILNSSALGYRHASMIEDTVNLAMTYLPNSTMDSGNSIIDSEGNEVGEKYLDNMKESIEYFLDVAYYKEPKGDTSGYLGNLRNKEQKEEAKKLKVTITDPDTTEEDKKKAKLALQNLGTRVTVTSLVRRVMDFIRIKALGWNIGAGVANLAYGTITNMYKAFDGRLFTVKDWLRAEKETLVSRKKFNNVVENYSIVGDILYEFEETNKFQEKQNWFFKKIKALKPYALQTSSEKKNQGTVMIAMMLNKQVTNNKGETKSLWEAINDNGTLSDEWALDGKKGHDAIVSMISSIKSQVSEIHGDYSSPLLIQKTLAGQAVSMFRKWFFETYHSRFGPQKPNYLTGIETKGRYRTAFELAKKFKLNPFALYRAYKKGELSKVDMANTRANLAEATTMVLSTLFAALLKKGICGDKQSARCKEASMYQLTLMNMYKRIDQDINFYSSPTAWKEMVTNPTALTGILGDVVKAYDLSYLSLFGEEGDLIYQSGYHKDEDKREVFIKSQIPVINQYERLKRFGDELVNIK